MVAIGGYGFYYLKALWEEMNPAEVQIVGIVDPASERSGHFAKIQQQGIPVFDTMESFYAAGHYADLAVISSPIHYHVPQSCVALQHGTHVLCDKPLGATVQEADELIRVRDASGKWVMIGYQWSYSDAVQALKVDILAGKFGRPIRAKTMCLWYRGDDYFQRNNWAGKLRSGDGRWILDSPVNNAFAHFLHNLLYLLGDDIPLSAVPEEVTAELYRVNPIENFDSVAARVITVNDVEVLFYGSHACRGWKDPVFELEFEHAVLSFGETEKTIVATYRNGNFHNYGAPDDSHQFKKLFDAVRAVNEPCDIVCGPEAARAQTLCINGIQESMPEIVPFPEKMCVRNEDEKRWWVNGLDVALYECYQKGVLPSELGYGWARGGERVSLEHYRSFPSRPLWR